VISALAGQFALSVLALALCATAMAQTRTLDVCVIDVEGGSATLFVSPSRQSLLIGNAGTAAARDAGRIIEAARDAGLQQIDI
jgi:competence protein ComEC